MPEIVHIFKITYPIGTEITWSGVFYCTKLRIFPKPLSRLAPKLHGLGWSLTRQIFWKKNKSNGCIFAEVIVDEIKLHEIACTYFQNY
jgi:hypothetical protein